MCISGDLQTAASQVPSSLRVLFVVDTLGAGGSERSLVELIPRLEARGFACGLCVLAEAPPPTLEEPETSLGVHRLRARTWLSRLRGVRRLMKEVGPDVLHTSLFRSNISGRLAAVGTGKTVLCSLVNTSYDPVRFADPRVSGWKLRVVRCVDGFTSRWLCDGFHAVSESVKQSAVRDLRLSEDRITVVVRGRSRELMGDVSSERRRECRAKFGLTEDDEVVVTTGRQVYAKNQAALVRAVAALAPERPRLVAILAGAEGGETAEIRRLVVEHGLEERVRLIGHRDDVPDLLAAADVFAFPSLHEGMPGSVIEAMALSLPVVASDIGALLEIVRHGKTGILVHPDGDWAGAIDRLLSRRDLATDLGNEARRQFDADFTLTSVADKMAQWLEELSRRAQLGSSARSRV